MFTITVHIGSRPSFSEYYGRRISGEFGGSGSDPDPAGSNVSGSGSDPDGSEVGSSKYWPDLHNYDVKHHSIFFITGNDG